MSKRMTRVLSLILTLVMFVTVSTPAFAWGGGDLGSGWDREIGEDEIRDFDEPVVEEEETLDYFHAIDEDSLLEVTVEAPMGALPTLAELRAEPVEIEDVREAVESVVDGKANILVAMDISFWMNGVEIEPEEPVNVKISAPELADKSNLTLVHIPDAAEPETIDLIDEGDLGFALGTNEVAFRAGSFSIYVIVGDDDVLKTPRTTYHFLSELKEDGSADPFIFLNKAGEQVDYQIVKGDELLDDPGQPVVGLEKNFLGWFVVDKNGETYSFPENGSPIDFEQQPPVKATITTGDLDVYVAPRYGKAFIVTFWDNAKGSPADQMHIVAKRVVYLDEGKTTTSVRVNDVTVPSAATQVLSGWTSDDYKTGEQTTYSLTEKKVWDQVTQSFNLYPIFSEGHWLRFSGGPAGSGAGYRSAIFVTENTQASELANFGTVAREGYTFAGWYYEGSEDDPFDGTEAATNASGATLNADDLLTRIKALGEGKSMTLYGHWTGNQVTYRVARWFENADDTNYSYGYTGVTALTEHTGAAGSTTTFTPETVAGFTAQTVEQQTIKGDGTTIVNVYYKRNEYTIRFYNRNTEITALRITAKYGADIHGEWPGVKAGTTNYSALWQVRNGNALVAGVSTMPLNGASYSQLSSGRYYQNTKLMTQNVDGSNNFTQYVERPFGYSEWLSTTVEDYTPIKGFSLNAASAADAQTIRNGAASDGSDPDATYNRNFRTSAAIGTYTYDGEQISQSGHNYYTLYFYYLRNQYAVSFNTLKSGAATPDPLTGIYYEANIASTKATQIAALNEQYKVGKTTVEVTGEGTYVFQGWYDNADGMGEPFNFNQKMPAGNITLYAKWERVYYLIQIDPRGGEILPDVNEVTYTWLQYGDKLEQYNIRRDYVEASSDYTGDKYYYVSVLAKDDENARESSGYYWSGYRKGFYIKTTDVNNEDYSWWKENGFIDTSVEYMPATTNDNWAFVGWYKATVDPTTHAVTDTNDVYDFSSLITGETAVYAKWRRSGLFSVQYHTENGTVSGQINGGLVATDSSYADQANTKVSYTPDKVSSTDNKRYVFVGWKLAQPVGFDAENPGNATLVGDLLKQGDTFTVDANYADSGHYIHLVAVYEPAETNSDTLPITTVTFNPNFPTDATGTSGEEKKVEGVPLNTAIDLSKESFTIKLADQDDREEAIPVFSCYGYVQIGWNHDKAAADDGTVEFKMNDTVGVDNADPKENILYAVWDHAYFYVFHSSDCTVEKIPMPTSAETKYNLTTLVKGDYLYGGYYSDYGKKGNYDIENPAEFISAVPNSTEYVGGIGPWKAANAIKTAKGTEMVPEAGKTYFLKEVPSAFLKSILYVIYDAKNVTTPNLIVHNYLIADVDDNNYNDIGLFATNISTGSRIKLATSYSIVDTFNNKTDKINAATFGATKGYVAVWKPDLATKDFDLVPYFVTPDGVTVEGAKVRSITWGNGTYQEWAAPGVTFSDADNENIIVPGQVQKAARS